MEEKKKITMRYKNWRGETALRNIIPKKIETIILIDLSIYI